MTLRGPQLSERNIALFLDVDGTLLEIAPTPNSVKVPAALRNTLQLAVQHEGGALALISGRAIADIDRLFAPCTFAVAGLHGLERRDADGNIHRPTIDAQALANARQTLRTMELSHKGLLLEDKGTTLAMHFRLAPKCESLVQRAMLNLVTQLGEQFVLRPGRFVLELSPSGFTKKTAIDAFMRERPFVGRVPVFVGDDITDEDGFVAVNTLGGYSIRVGHDQTTQAKYRFGSVSAVIAWLRERNLDPGLQKAR
jgi:trehalose 6-phosphate phosphatase